MTTSQYQQQFNKQLAQQLDQVRKQQPNHIPVYSMKYKNASKYLVEDLKQPLALFPKKFKLKSVYDMIQKQSQAFCKQKLIKTDSKVMQQGDNFKIPTFHLYTIQIIKKNQQQQNEKDQANNSKQRPIGKFVKLDLQMSFQEAFDKYGRQNVLTLVYTDAEQVRYQYTQAQRTVQKWVKRLLIFILILIIIPYLMRDQQSKYQSNRVYQKVQTNQQPNIIMDRNYEIEEQNIIFSKDDQLLDDRLYIDTVEDHQSIYTLKQRTIEYDDQTI